MEEPGRDAPKVRNIGSAKMNEPCLGRARLPIGSKVVPFCGLYLESYKVTPKKELLRSLWVASPSLGAMLVLTRSSSA